MKPRESFILRQLGYVSNFETVPQYYRNLLNQLPYQLRLVGKKILNPQLKVDSEIERKAMKYKQFPNNPERFYNISNS